jgi:hypothetical protein
LSDSEVITLEIVGEMLGHDGDEAIWTYFKRHWAAWFPGLGDRSTFRSPDLRDFNVTLVQKNAGPA